MSYLNRNRRAEKLGMDTFRGKKVAISGPAKVHLKRCGSWEYGNDDGKKLWKDLKGGMLWAWIENGKGGGRACYK